MSVTALKTAVNRDLARAWVRDLVEHQGAQYTYIAREIGYSHTALMRFVNEDHGADEIAERLLALKESWEAKKEAAAAAERLPQPIKSTIDFILTEDARRVMAVCEFCAKESAIGVVVGHAGAGKTTALRRFCQGNPGALYISADVTMSTRGVLEEIAERLRLDTKGPLRVLLRRLVEHLSREPRLIVVDEADVLVSYSDETVRKIEVLRPLHDQAGVSIILAGLPRLKAFLTRGPSLKQDLEQLYSRVKIMAELRGLTRDEAVALLSDYPLTDGARELLLSMALNHAQGGMRRLTTLLKRCIDMANLRGSWITRDIVEAADGLALR